MDTLIPVIAQIARKDASLLKPDTRLDQIGLETSIGRSILRTALERRFQRKLPSLDLSLTLAELAALLASGTPAATTLPAPIAASRPVAKPAPAAAPPASTWGHGVDIEDVAALPETIEFSTHPFYQDHFAPEELAYALATAQPRMHLCGFFCAKEAVKKADPILTSLGFGEIVVTHDAAGRPAVRLARPDLAARFTLLLSLSHTPTVAVASVISIRR